MSAHEAVAQPRHTTLIDRYIINHDIDIIIIFSIYTGSENLPDLKARVSWQSNYWQFP